MTLEESKAQIYIDRLESVETNLFELAQREAAQMPINFLRVRDFLELGDKVQWLRLHSGSLDERKAGSAAQEPTAETPLVTTWQDKGQTVMEPSRDAETKTKGDIAADAIIAAFEGEEYLADSDLLKASGLKRSEYIEVRDFLLNETCELVEMEAEEDGITVYSYAKPRKQNAAA